MTKMKKNVYSSNSDNNSSRKVQLMLSVLNGWLRGDNGILKIEEIKKTGSGIKAEYKGTDTVTSVLLPFRAAVLLTDVDR